jgi:integrase
MPAMPKRLPLHVVQERSRHGRRKLFFRIDKGPRIRLPDDPNSPEFKAAYAAALIGAPVLAVRSPEAPTQSLRWLVDRYKESAAWKGYSDATRRQQENFFLGAIKRSGNTDFRDIDQAAIERAMDERGDRPALANNFLKAMRALFAWAAKNKHVEVNPTLGVENLKYQTDGFEPWTMADFEQFCARWPIGTKPRLAAELLLHSGLRRSDVVVAGRQHMSGRVITIRTAKTGTTVTLEFPPELVAVIDASKTGELAFLVTDHGRPYTKESFGNWFRDRCNDAGIKKSAHGVRKLAATISADEGASAHELMAHFGWSTIKQAEVYTKGADRKKLGVLGSQRVSAAVRKKAE